MKTSELTGAALDWAVAKCEGYFDEQSEYWATAAGAKHFMGMRDGDVHWTHISTDWAQGGPIIERERIGVQPIYQGYTIAHWSAVQEIGEGRRSGPTPLVAAMRCYVASKLGDDVEVPDELH